jgi:hypothetical protein
MSEMTMKNNAIRVLGLYRFAGTWVFDDDEVGLKREAFVMGAPTVIDRALLDAGGDYEMREIRLLFSGDPFPDSIEAVSRESPYNFLTTRGSRALSDDSPMKWGQWYEVPAMDNETAWLCPATLHYFDDYPERIHFKVEVIER